jgi:hypothetical protein
VAQSHVLSTTVPTLLRTEYGVCTKAYSTATERSYGQDGFDSTSCSCAARLDRPDGGQATGEMDHGSWMGG